MSNELGSFSHNGAESKSKDKTVDENLDQTQNGLFWCAHDSYAVILAVMFKLPLSKDACEIHIGVLEYHHGHGQLNISFKWNTRKDLLHDYDKSNNHLNFEH